MSKKIKMKLKNIQFLCFLLLITFSSLYAQDFLKKNQSLKFKKFSLSEGLSQSSVLSILQDSKGFLWFGTRDGLNKYDGNTFKTYRYDYKNENSISNGFIKALLEDENGNIWIGTNNGLNKYLPNEDKFVRYIHNKNEKGLNNNEISALAKAANNFLWIGTNSGLEKFNILTGESEQVLKRNKNIDGNLKNKIKSLFVTANNLWICNGENIIVFNSKENTIESFEYPKNEFTKPKKNYSPVIYEDKKSNIWLGYKDGLAKFNSEKNKFEKFEIPLNKTSKIDVEVRTILEDSFENLWIGTYNGLYILNKEKNVIKHFLYDQNNIHSLSQNSIFKIIEDIKGDIWIGTYSGGINYYDRSYDVFKHYKSGDKNQKLNYKVVSSIIQDSLNNLWIGTEGGGINYLNRETNQFTYYTHNKNDANSISTNNVKSIIKTKKGNLWIGTHNGGLNFLNPNKKPFSFKKYRYNSIKKNGLSSDRIISLFEDENENLWIGTSGAGLNFMTVSNNSFLKITDSLNHIGEIIFSITKSQEKNTILVSGSRGLSKVEIQTKKINPINYRLENEKEENTNITLCTYEDKLGNLWIGTEGNGLYYFDVNTQRSTKYSIADGLPNEVIYSILPDDNNNLWLSTNKGLSRLNLETKQFKNIDVYDGILENEFNYGSRIKLKNNELMFGSANGIVYFNPKDINENSFIPPVYITSILVNNKPYLSGINLNKTIKLNHNQNVFSFSFIALSYSQPEKNQYAYKLEGFDKDWNYIKYKKFATYTNLDPGDYVFRVKASNSDNIWNEEGQSVIIKILPPFWKTWWAYLIYIIVCVTLILVARKYILLRIYEKNELKQERLEKERIEKINRLKLKLFTNISHDFRTPLTLIIGPLERMLKNKEGDNYVQGQHQIMFRNASVLLELINQLLDFRKFESGKLKLNSAQNNIIPFVDDIKKSFNELANHRNINYTLKYENEETFVLFDAISLKKVLYNLLSNAFKFTAENGFVKIKISTNKEAKWGKKFIKIEVADNGKGIPKKDIKFIFDRFFQIDRDENTGFGSGIGLALAKSIVELHKGEIKVKSEENKGTKFIILLPLEGHHLNEGENITKNIQLEEAAISEKLLKGNSVTNPTEKSENIENAKCLLIVEDNDEVRNFIKHIFEKEYFILEANNGEIALEIITNNNVNIIISDVMMPIMDGTELCNQIKTNILYSHIPVILLTAKTSEKSQKEGFETGADAYITKPFSASLLEVRVKNLLQTRENLINKIKKDIILKPKELKITSLDEIFLEKSISIIEENIKKVDFTINDFIAEMGMSRSAYYRKLKALTGQSITEFIRTIKLKRAAQLIAKSKLNISEIAYDLGFNDLKYFRKSFKKLFKELPSQYRTNNSNKNL